MIKKTTIAAVALLAFAFSAVAEMVSQETALAVAEGFIRPGGFGARLLPDRSVSSATAWGNLWIVALEPSGYIILAGSDKCSPITFFSSQDFVEPEVGSPFSAKLTSDSAWVAEKEADGSADVNPEWAKLTAPATKKRTLLKAAPSGTTGVVGPLMNCGWAQGAPFNDLSPLSSLCGCMATAAGQEHRYWRWPYRYEKSRLGRHGLRNSLNEYSEHVMRPDGRVPFNYDKVVAYAPNPASTPRATDKEATYQTAFLSLWMQSLTGMSYKPGASGGTQKLCNFAEQYWFEAGPVMSYWRDGYTNLWNAIKADLDFGSPIQVNSPGHQMVVDGYAIENEGTDSEVDYVNINYGWGYPEGWVNLLTAVTESTSGGRLADFQIGYRPQKIVQFEPVPKVCTSEVTLKWHLPPCYTNRTTGFAVEIAKDGGEPTVDNVSTHEETTTYTATGLASGSTYTFTVIPLMSDNSEARANFVTTTIGTPKAVPEILGVSSVACGIELMQQGLFVECGRGITNKINVACSTSVTRLDAYSSHLTVLPDNKVSCVDNGSGSWTVNVDATSMSKDWEGDMLILTLVAANADGTEAYKNLMLRFNSMRNVLGGTFEIVETSATSPVWFAGGTTTTLDAKGQAVTFASGAVNGTGTIILTDSVGNGSFTFQGLDGFKGTLHITDKVGVTLPRDMSMYTGVLEYDHPVAHNWQAYHYTISNDLPATAKLSVPSAVILYIDNATIDAALVGNGAIYIIDGSSRLNNTKDFAGRIHVGDGEATPTVTLLAGQEKGVSIWSGTLFLTLDKAQVAYGYSTDQINDLQTPVPEITDGGRLVFQDENGTQLAQWTSAQSTYSIASTANTWTPDSSTGTGNFWDAARWSQGLPNAGDYVIFNDTVGDSEMTLNLSSDFNLGYVLVTGTKLTISNTADTAMLSVDTFRNTAIAAILTLKCAPTTVVPEGKLRLLSGLGIDCEVDSSLADNMKWYYSDTVPAMYFADIWKGTVVFAGYAAANLDLSYWANDDSVVRLNGVTGYLKANTEFPYPVELVDNGETSALNWSDGSSGAQSTFDILTGTGTFKTSGSGGSTEKVLIKDISCFAGSFNLAAKNVAIADAMPEEATASNGRLYVEKEVEISAGKGWAANGGLYLGAGANLTVSGAFATGSAINTYGEGTVLTLEDGGSVKVNGAIAGDNAPTLNFKAGTYQITRNVTETKTVNFCAAAGKYTTLDADGNTFTLGANFFSGSGDVYLKTSTSGGMFVIQGMPAAYTGTIYVDNSIVLTISGDLTQMGGKLNISDITLSRDSSNLGKIDVCAGATLQVVLTDREAMSSFTPSGVTLLGGTIEYVDQRGTIITTSTESVAYTKPDDYSVPAPEPTAVWVSGQFEDDAELHGGYAISTQLAGSINAAGNIVIGDSAYLGAQISLPENTYTKASVLVKFKAPAGGAPATNSVIAGLFDTSEYPIGAICKTAGGTTFEGYYQAKNGTALTTGYNLSSPTIPGGEGYMLFSFQSDPTSIQPATGTALYLGDAIANLTGGAWAGLQWRGHTISKLAIGGPAVATPSPWKGLEIESVALFAGEWFSPSDVEFYEFPTPVEPEYEGPDPVAVWVAGEFGDDRSAHGGLEISLNGNNTNALGQIVISDDVTTGATIKLPEDTFTKASILVKYELASEGAPVANAAPVGVISTDGYPIVPICTTKGGTVLKGAYLNKDNAYALVTNSGNYWPFSVAPTISNGEGYILLSYHSELANPMSHGTAVYVGSSVNTLTGGNASGLQWKTKNIDKIAIGGPTTAGGANPWKGMIIKGVALFTDEWLTPTDLANYKFPERGAVLPEDSDRYAIEPVAKWVNDFKTTEKNGCTLSVSGTTGAKDDSFGGVLTIGNAAAVIDVTSTNALTVLVKYRATPDIQSAPVVAFGGQAAVTFDSGICTDTNVTRQLSAYYSFIYNNARQRAINAVDGNPTLSSDGGYVVCARKYNACHAYVGDSLDNMTGGECTTGMLISNSTLKKIGIGGQTELSSNDANMVPFTGFVVEKVVVFNGYYTPADLTGLNIKDGETKSFTAGETEEYPAIGKLSSTGTIKIANASELSEGTYKLAEWTTPQRYTTECAGYGKVGTLVTEGLAAGLSARLIYGARAIYLRVDDTAKQVARKPLVILPYGDSITEGFNAQHTGANYRILLYQKLELLGFNVKSAGIYGLDDGYNSVDPTGTALADQYRWHSAKHGAVTGRSTATGSGRGDLEENVDTVCAQAGKPDAVLLHIGINDLVSHDRVDTTDLAKPVYISWSNVVWRLVKDLPETKIVVSTVLYGSGGQATRKITKNDVQIPLTDLINDFNDRIKNSISDFPEGHVFLADLNAYVKSTENGILYDGTHPDWWGYDQMAEGWLSVITNQFSASQSQNFPSATPIVAPTSDKLGAAAKEELADYINGFKRYAVIEGDKNILPTLETAIPYSQVNNDAATTDIKKVGYFVEYVRNDNNVHKWVWVDMDAFGDTIEEVGLPKAKHQCVVSSLHVKSNHGAIDDVPANDDTVKGFVEFSPFDYSAGTSNVEGGPKDYSCYDWNDTLSDSGSKSCMQVHRIISSTSAPGGQVLFAYNNWRSGSSEAEFGIGNFSQHFYGGTKTFDYSETKNIETMNAGAYSVKRIEIWTKGVNDEPEEKTTSTENGAYPVPYSWFSIYDDSITDDKVESRAKTKASNNLNTWWECYVLGLDPTNETSKFLATIRMNGTTPIVEYSPTNTTLGNITYVLQGKPALSNDWQNVEFDAPGATNRFFRVKVTW